MLALSKKSEEAPGESVPNFYLVLFSTGVTSVCFLILLWQALAAFVAFATYDIDGIALLRIVILIFASSSVPALILLGVFRFKGRYGVAWPLVPLLLGLGLAFVVLSLIAATIAAKPIDPGMITDNYYDLIDWLPFLEGTPVFGEPPDPDESLQLLNAYLDWVSGASLEFGGAFFTTGLIEVVGLVLRSSIVDILSSDDD